MTNTPQLQCDICGFLVETPQGLSGHKQFKHGVAPPRKPEHAGRSSGDIAHGRHLDQRIDEVIGKLHDSGTAELTGFSDELLVVWVHQSTLEQLISDLEALSKRTADQRSAIIKHLTEVYKLCEALKAAQRATDNENAMLSEQLKGLNAQMRRLAQQVSDADKHAKQRRVPIRQH
jgi:chromosome segregation ATPase